MSSPLMCPSAPAQDGAVILGVFVGGRLAFLRPALAVSRDDLVGAGEALDERFRFSTPCARGSCHNYAGHGCGLIGSLLADQGRRKDAGQTADLPDCALRGACQWFHTAGADACGVCPTVYRPLSRTAPHARNVVKGGGL